jgi:hypothetical protein
MPANPSRQLRALDRIKDEFGGTAGVSKSRLLAGLERGRLRRAAEVLRLHEALCFLHAYPDDPQLLQRVERMLAGFDRRSDLRRFRHDLVNSGIAGTAIHYAFFYPMAIWLARRWGDRLRIDWQEFDRPERLDAWVRLLALPAEDTALDEIDATAREWIERFRRPGETDAAFLIRRASRLQLSLRAREVLFDDLVVPLRLDPGPGTPSRTRARFPGLPVAFQVRPLRRDRPSLRREVNRRPAAIRPLAGRRARAMIDLARAAMVTRERDLDVFAFGDPDDVRLVDFGDGLQFACIGVVPEKRLLLEATYGFLTLKNRVPTGYVLCSALFGSSEIAFNVFDTYRGAEAAYFYSRVLAMVRHLFGSDTFTVYPFQLGHENPEGLRSGAWWFYQKLGFRPRDPGVVRLMRRELGRMRSRPGYRSGIATLKRLARENVYLHLDRRRDDVIGLLPLSGVGLHLTRYLARRFGSDRDRASRICGGEAAARLGLRKPPGRSAAERLAWARWSPLLLILPGIERWSAADRRELVRVVLAKGGRRESDFALRFDRHRKLRAAIRRLATTEPDQNIPPTR